MIHIPVETIRIPIKPTNYYEKDVHRVPAARRGSAPGRRRHARSRAHAISNQESLESLESIEDPDAVSNIRNIRHSNRIDSPLSKM